ncbi:GFA family protein [Parathalassolituus penaei]|uniref:GFA family protein n=1 Tax=Parathalassolituus penaei TaxID=2997323 RepID=A0A9X3EBQ0_9GAMM|nr:GFA family protein [Parathalassolituus penaei]MCY0964602.1 GFA family protein [Parathalassolituus penaei]
MLKGSCLCGAVQYELDGELGPMVMCHCQRCRKANGAAYAVNAPINSAEFRWVSGETALAEFESSPGVLRVFCQRCASPLISRRVSQPELFRLRLGTLDTPIDARPTAHIFVGSKAEWDEIHDDLPQYTERP